MNTPARASAFFPAWLSALLMLAPVARSAPQVIELWKDAAPGETAAIGEEKDQTKASDNLIAGKPVIRLGNVSKPTLTIYKPPAEKDTGATVMVCPGGGYHILAWDLEGTEVCEWLNSIGVTGALLKYRVPRREGRDRYAAPLQDAQRAMGLLRLQSAALRIDPDRVGVLGFSAGGHLGAALSTAAGPRSYEPVDAADKLSARPDFVILVYPGGLTVKDQGDRISPELIITSNTPPHFIVMTQDDGVRVENALFYSLALKNAKVPCELHVYPKGGHGYGLRRTADVVTTWPDRAADWMRAGDWLKAR